MEEREKKKIFKITLASGIMATTLAKDDTNLHVKGFVLFDLSISYFQLNHPITWPVLVAFHPVSLKYCVTCVSL
jgi:hypothetical protein